MIRLSKDIGQGQVMVGDIVGQTFDTILAALVATIAVQHIKTMTN